MSETPIRVAVTYRVCQHWRAHIFARLNRRPDLEVAVFHGQSIPGTKCINGEKLEGFEHIEHHTWWTRWTGTWAVQPFMAGSLGKYRPDVILSEGGSNLLTNFLVLLYAKLSGTPVIWWTLGELQGRTYKGFFRKAYRWLVQFQERRCDVYLGYSDVALDYFLRQGYAREDCFVAVNCVDTDRVFADIESRSQDVIRLRNELQLAGKRVILFVGAFTGAKRIDRLLRVFARLKDDFPDTVLLLVGDGSAGDAVRQLAAELQLGDRVLFPGSVVEGVSDYYELGDVFVLPGLGGLAISEAMAHRMPVLCTYADGCEVNYVVDGETGFRLFSDNDQEVEAFLEDRLRRLLADPAELDRMSEAALQCIRHQHNVDTYTDKIVAAIEHAVGRPAVSTTAQPGSQS